MRRLRQVGGVASGFFFFSSRRRHTRFDCDWSSDVCSSDLDEVECDGVALLCPGSRNSHQKCGDGDGDNRFGSGYDAASNRGDDAMNERSEEHTSELQSQSNLVCRLLLEKKKIYKRHQLQRQ